MDFVRSCYSTTMRFQADPEILDRVTWYFAPGGAKLFPRRHSFGSLNWSDGKPTNNVIGEVVGASRPYSHGSTPFGVTGQNFCGEPYMYRRGSPLNSPPSFLLPNNLPVCCEYDPCATWPNPQPGCGFSTTPDWDYLQTTFNVSRGQYIWGPIAGFPGSNMVWYQVNPEPNCRGFSTAGVVIRPYGSTVDEVNLTPIASRDELPWQSEWKVPSTSLIWPGAVIQLSANACIPTSSSSSSSSPPPPPPPSSSSSSSPPPPPPPPGAYVRQWTTAGAAGTVTFPVPVLNTSIVSVWMFAGLGPGSTFTAADYPLGWSLNGQNSYFAVPPFDFVALAQAVAGGLGGTSFGPFAAGIAGSGNPISLVALEVAGVGSSIEDQMANSGSGSAASIGGSVSVNAPLAVIGGWVGSSIDTMSDGSVPSLINIFAVGGGFQGAVFFGCAAVGGTSIFASTAFVETYWCSTYTTYY
jgi:hypothetical protein